MTGQDVLGTNQHKGTGGWGVEQTLTETKREDKNDTLKRSKRTDETYKNEN